MTPEALPDGTVPALNPNGLKSDEVTRPREDFIIHSNIWQGLSITILF
jgi:hypothetical protein